MSKIALTPNANGSGVFTLASPNSNTNRTITLPDESVTLGAGTPSIDDNGNATAITIDSSENVMVGTANSNPTSSAVNVAGQSFSTTGGVRSTVASNAAATFNRKTDDGGIVLFRKDGTTVGSIGSVSGVDLFVAGNRGAGQRYLLNNILPCNASGDVIDNTIDFGQSANRYKDLYLSGGIYLGGVVSANKLDDYEEGTWTPATSVGTASSASGTYTKIGRMVVVTGFVSGMNSVNNEVLNIQGLPFTGGNTVQCVGQAMWSNVDKDFGYEQVFYTGGSKFQFYHTTNANFDAIRHVDLDGSNSACYFSATYLV